MTSHVVMLKITELMATSKTDRRGCTVTRYGSVSVCTAAKLCLPTAGLVNEWAACQNYVTFSRELAATLRGSRPGLQSASLIMTSLMTS